ncbi:MAG: hypothetical protein HZA90_19765 [Verrucomicrobia bacterium]|nr:hypothetical protein [Verrucomicrobiota bacterium]
MKKLLRIFLVLVVIVVLAVVAVAYFMGSIIKTGVETFGPKVAKVETKLDSANISFLSGKGSLKGIFVGNPEGFKAPSAIKVGEVSVALKPASVFSDKIVIESVQIVGPEITAFGLGADNLRKILDNLQASTGGSGTQPTGTNKTDQAAGKKLQVDDFLIKDGKVNVILPVVGTATVPLPTIHLTGLGQDANGITGGELANRVMKAVLDGVLASAKDLTKSGGKLFQGVGKEAGGAAEKVTKGLGDLFKK